MEPQGKEPDARAFYQLKNIITDNNLLPKISILTPCYLRKKYLNLMLTNLNYFNYPKDKIEWVVLQDGPVPLIDNIEEVRRQINPIKLNYKYESNLRRTIGEKRNRLVKMASNKICINMDSDDIYFQNYPRYCVSVMKDAKATIVSSCGMMFLYPRHNWAVTAIQCQFKRQGHEGCMAFTKNHHKCSGGFVKNGNGEGTKMIDHAENLMQNLDIRQCML